MDVSGRGEKAVPRIEVAVVSAGGAGRAHIQRFVKNPRVNLVAIYDPREEMLKEFSWLESAGGYTTTEYRELLEDNRIELISICSPDHTHVEYAKNAVEAGKHVLVEKPMATTLEQCEELRRTLEGARIKFGVHHQMRYVPCFRKAKEILGSGRLGTPLIIEADYVHDMRERATRFDSWRLGKSEPQEVVLGMSSHTIDLIRWMVDEEVEEVFAYATHVGWEEYPTYDTVMVLLKFRDNIIGKTMSTIACRRTQMNTLYIYGVDGCIVDNLLITRNGLEEIFHKLPAESPGAKLRSIQARMLSASNKMQNYPFTIYEHEKACKDLLDDYLECIIEDREFGVGFSEGAYTVEICLACAESYKTGKPVKLRRSL